jgi:hypothetical protein
LDPEDRALQIKLAQLNSNIQIGLAWVFGSLGADLTFIVLGYQVIKDYSYVTIAAWIGASMFLLSAFVWMHRVNGYSNELEKLK